MPKINKDQLLALMGISYKSGGNDMIDNIKDMIGQCVVVDESLTKLIAAIDGLKQPNASMEDIDKVIAEITNE